MRVAWLFPGQGSQAVGMAADVAEASPAARSVFQECDRVLSPGSINPYEPLTLSHLIFKGPEDQLMMTVNAQPALVATSMALLAALRERFPELPPPDYAAGHSLGEYSALVAAGALSLQDAVRSVRVRGRAMQDAVPVGVGTMAAFMGLEAPAVVDICQQAVADSGEVVAPANYNAPGQIVVAGHAAAVTRAGELAAAAKGRVITLKVSAPFHCSLMAPAAQRLRKQLDLIGVAPLAFPVVSNVDAEPNDDPARVTDLLVRQVSGAVRWDESVRRMAELGVTHALEIGPGKTLAGLVRRIAKDMKVHAVSSLAGIDGVKEFLN